MTTLQKFLKSLSQEASASVYNNFGPKATFCMNTGRVSTPSTKDAGAFVMYDGHLALVDKMIGDRDVIAEVF